MPMQPTPTQPTPAPLTPTPPTSTPLHGRIALVTGSSRGIGAAIAVALAGAGAELFCVSTRAGGCADTIARIEAGGGKAHGFACDVAQAEAVEALGKQVLQQAGRLDILVNNAGITRDGVFLRMSTEDFDAVVSTNLRGTFLVCRAFARALAKSKTGRIVNVGSVVGLTGNPGQANYAASKAGLIGLTRSVAKELAGRGVTANLVAPGFIVTDMTTGVPAEHRDAMLKSIPLGRFGQADDVAAAVLFLCSDAAAYVTGQCLVVDGGMTM